MPDTSTLNQADPVAGPIDDITVVDRAAFDGPSDDTIALIRSACRDTGYFCIGPDARQRECIDAALGRMRDFFALQDEKVILSYLNFHNEKMTVHVYDGNTRIFTKPLGNELAMHRSIDMKALTRGDYNLLLTDKHNQYWFSFSK